MSGCQMTGVVHYGIDFAVNEECGAPVKYRAATYTYTAPDGDYLPLEFCVCDDHLSLAVDLLAAKSDTVVAVSTIREKEATP